MADKKGVGAGKLTLIILVGLIGFAFVSVSCCCGGLCFGVPMLKDYALSYIFEDQPMAIAPAPSVAMTGDELYDKLVRDAGEGGTVVWDGREINGAIQSKFGGSSNLAFEITGGDVRFDLSVQFPDDDHYFNVHLLGRALMVRGLFEDFYLDEFKVGAMDLGVVKGENMATNVNEQLMNQRNEEPAFAAWLDAIDRAEFKDGSLHLTIGPGGIPK